MKQFMSKDFLLHSETAQILYHDYAKSCPIYDYHNHLQVQEIAQRRVFHNLTELWLEADHYKWRAMRAMGVDEAYITGSADEWEKFLAWATVVPQLIGNPLHHWTHLELQRYFGIEQTLCPQTAKQIWAQTQEQLQTSGYDAVGLLQKQAVQVLCTTDDPADTLQWHRQIRDDASIPIAVLPSFRPDAYLNFLQPQWKAQVARLGARYDMQIQSFAALKAALIKALDFFVQNGCRVADHGFQEYLDCRGDADAAFRRIMEQTTCTTQDAAICQSALLRFLGQEYAKRGMLMQMHLGACRNNSPRLKALLGADAGADSIGRPTDPFALAQLLGDLEATGHLPQMILYNLNPAENASLAAMTGNFSPRVQFGTAWWFNDHLAGIRAQLEELLLAGQLSCAMGMLTDSRSLTSFVRHEYYRRILCNLLAEKVENGEYPMDIPFVGSIICRVCAENAAQFFSSL